MKKIVKSLILIAAAAMGFTACQEELQNDAPLTEETVEVKFVASSADTKTSVDTSGEVPVFAWGENETFTVLEQTDALAAATSVTYEKVDGKANITATFAANAGKESYNYVTVYPASGYVSAESLAAATLSLPAVQTMAEGSYDPTADLMVSEVVSANAQPTEAQMVRFTRLAAVAKMTLKNFALESGDEVEQVIFTADGKNLAGTVTANLNDPHAFTVADDNGVDNVTVNTTSSTDVYFTVLPTTLEAGDAYTVAVITKEKLYIKTGTIPAEKSLAFEAGMVTRFNVNMSGVAPSEKWVLVRDASTLKQGDIVTIAAKNYNCVLGSKYNSTSYPYASYTSVVKSGDYLYHPIADASASVDNRIQHIALMQRDKDKVAFDFYNAKEEYTGDDKSGYYSSTSTNQHFRLQDYPNQNTLFYVTIDEGVASIVAQDSEFDNKYLQYKKGYTNTSTSRYFQLRKLGDVTEDAAVCLYRLATRRVEIPTVPANITVPTSDVKIAEEGTTNDTPISGVVFNYVGDWTISVSSSENWLKVYYADGVLTYTAEANLGDERTTTVTITATLGDETLVPWTFKVTQKCAPREISVAEFIQLETNLDIRYKLTGKVTSVADKASGTYVLEDENGNKANIKYLYTEDNKSVWGNEDFTLKLGDIATVTTVVTSTATGGNSSNHSTYKGHYRLTASADMVEYTGGDATITVETSSNGYVTAPSTIDGTMPVCDYAIFTYSGGSTGTVIFAENSGRTRSVDVTFTCGLATTTIKVSQKNHPSIQVGWFLVTDTNELEIGDKVIIAAKNPDETLDYAIKVPTSNNPSTSPGQAIKLDGNLISDVTGVEQFTLEKGYVDYPGTWAFKGDTYGRYLYVSSGALKLKTSIDKHGSWEISIESDGKAKLVSKTATSASSKNTMMFNYVETNQTFSAYASTQAGKGAIYLYKYYE